MRRGKGAYHYDSTFKYLSASAGTMSEKILRELRPNKQVFFSYHLFQRFISFLIFFGILYTIIVQFVSFSIVFLLLPIIFFTLLSAVTLFVRSRKEQYIFFEDKIVRISGGVFWDSRAELPLRNITHVALELPFLENKLFGTGNLSIESAGSDATEIFLIAIDTPQEYYTFVEKLMRSAGFRLAKNRLVQEEGPSPIGVFFDVFKQIFGLAFFIFVIGSWIVGSAPGIFGYLTNGFIVSIALLLMLWLFAKYIFSFLDLYNRVYRVYDSVITYSEGFLTKRYAFIPMENLADSLTTQTLVDKIFGLYDVTLSCQGSGQEIFFANMMRGPELEKTIDGLIAKTKPLIRVQRDRLKGGAKETEVMGHTQMKSIQSSSPKSAKLSRPLKDVRFAAEFRMDALRTIISQIFGLPIAVILFPLFPFWIFGLVMWIIRMTATRYLVKAHSMEERYNFLSSKNKEFTNDKIVAVIFKENLFDRWFGTCSIHFWSIGSSADLRFVNIKKTEDLYSNILAKFGMHPQATQYSMRSQFSIFEMLKANIFTTLFAGLFCIVLLAASLVITPLLLLPIILILLVLCAFVIYRYIYYDRSRLSFFKEYLCFQRGIIFTEKYYILHDAVKDMTIVRYPFAQHGKITFDVGGERVVGQGEDQSVVSNGFSIRYVPDIPVKNEVLDYMFLKNPSASQIVQYERMVSRAASTAVLSKTILTARPALANSLLGLFVASTIIFPLLVFLPLTIPLMIVHVRCRSFLLQEHRVVTRSGIVYKKQISILMRKIDHTNLRRGMFNKLFANGTIMVNTVGSSKPEITVNDISNYNEFYTALRKLY